MHVDEERLLVFAHPPQQQRPLLQQAWQGKHTRSLRCSEQNTFYNPAETLSDVSTSVHEVICVSEGSSISEVSKSYATRREVGVTPFLTIKGKVTDESRWFVAGRNIEKGQQLVPELSQVSLLLPGSDGCNSCSSTEAFC